MIQSPGVRKVALTAHVTVSLGWFGAVLAFLGMAVVGLASEDGAAVRGVYLVMEPVARLVLLPLCVASLVTGIVQSLVTHWGLFRHYWVVFKLVLTLLATVVLVMYMGTFRAMAAVAADAGTGLELVRNPSPLIHAVLALLVLLAATVLAVFKPRGLTRYGWRKQQTTRFLSG